MKLSFNGDGPINGNENNAKNELYNSQINDKSLSPLKYIPPAIIRKSISLSSMKRNKL